MEKYLNHYECSQDGERWSDESYYTNNDRCPECNSEIEPHQSDDLSLKSKDLIILSIRQAIKNTPLSHKLNDSDLDSLANSALKAVESFAISSECLLDFDRPDDIEPVQSVSLPWLEGAFQKAGVE
jgi:hypothetical protein